MDEGQIEKIDLDKVDWRGSREFFESLGEALDRLDDKDEAYDFTWVGKRKAIIEAGAPINKTFRPDVASSKNWDTTENLFIEGDNLDALKLLQESYLGKVKMIYIDPPYNTGKDFVYHDDFRGAVDEDKEETGYKDEEGNITYNYLKKNEKTNGRYHSDWLSMMYPRLKLARNLLTKDGVIFISIDDNEQANLKKLCDEVFGEDTFVTQISWYKSYGKNESRYFSNNIEYIFVYQRGDLEHEFLKPKDGLSEVRELLLVAQNSGKTPADAQAELRVFFKSNSHLKGISAYNNVSDNFDAWRSVSMEKPKDPQYFYDIIHPVTGKACKIPKKGWRMPESTAKKYLDEDRIVFGKDEGTIPNRKYYLSEVESERAKNFIENSDQGGNDIQQLFPEGQFFDYPKATSVIKYILSLSNLGHGDVVLDFFSGSATTAHAVMQLNAEDGGSRKWIMVQLPEETDEKSEAFKAGYKTIPDISRERIRRAGDKIAAEHPEAKVDYGFRSLVIDDTNYKEVYKSVGKYEQSTLLGSVDNVKEDRSDLDLLFGVLTQSALELNRPLETRDISGAKTFLYDYFGEVSGLVACFDESISEEAVKAIAGLRPLTAVFRDSSFADSQAKVNLAEHFRIISPETKVKVI